MSGDVFVVRAVPETVKLSDTRLSKASDQDGQRIEEVKEELSGSDSSNNGHDKK